MIHFPALFSACCRTPCGAERDAEQRGRIEQTDFFREIESRKVKNRGIIRARMHFRHFRFALLLIGLLLAGLPVMTCKAGAQEAADRDVYQQKAQMIFAFLRQTVWPQRKLQGANVPLVVGIYGPDRVSGYLEEIIAGQTVNGRTVMIKRVSAKEELGMCHLLYVSSTDAARVAIALHESHHDNVLTVGETVNFNESGGVIQFLDTDGRLGYVANLENAKRERLTLGGFLLKASGAQVKAAPARKSGSTTAEDSNDKTSPARLANIPPRP
jgi:hypothetical protein